MKVAVVVSNAEPSAGGAFTFEESVKEALLALNPADLEFVFYALRPQQPKSEGFGGRVARRLVLIWASLSKLFGLVSQFEFMAWKKVVEDESLKNPSGWNTDSWLNRTIVADGCHIAYFLTPGMAPVEIPFLATHWDLGHRRWPIFPEVSLSGWTWGAREWYYTHWLQRASLIQTGTQTGKAELMTAYGIQDANIVVNPFPVPSWIAKTLPQPLAGFDDRVPFVYYPAQFWPHKNHVVLLEAFRLLKAEGLSVGLVLTGSDKGNLSYVQGLVTEYDLSDRVWFPGFISRAEMVWLYKNSRLMVFPCFVGPDNLPPLEALALGARVAVADIPGARDYLPAGSVDYFDPKDEVGLACLLKSVLALPSSAVSQVRASLPTADDYARNVVHSLQGLAAYRRCWGFGYRHQ